MDRRRRRRQESVGHVTAPVDAHSSRRRQLIKEEKENSDRKVQPLFGTSGMILSRTTKLALVRRRWQNTLWVHYLPTTILIFRSVEDFYQWIETGDMTMLDLKSSLILSVFDFDTQGIQKKGEQEKHSSNMRRLCNSKMHSSKIVSRVEKLSITTVHTKLYGSEALHSFKLERWCDVGVNTLAAFASAQPRDVAQLRRAMYECLDLATPTRRKRNIPDNVSDITGLRTADLTEMVSLVDPTFSLSSRSNSYRHLNAAPVNFPRRHRPTGPVR